MQSTTAVLPFTPEEPSLVMFSEPPPLLELPVRVAEIVGPGVGVAVGFAVA